MSEQLRVLSRLARVRGLSGVSLVLELASWGAVGAVGTSLEGVVDGHRTFWDDVLLAPVLA